MDVLQKMTTMTTKDPATGCWNWQRAKSAGGYGQLWVPPKVMYAHRLSYEIHFGEIPAGKQVDHRCRNRACWNPDHLRIATPAENSQNTSERPTNTSGVRGVFWHKGARKWQAGLQKDGKAIYLGLHETLEAAEKTVVEARRQYFPYSEMDKVRAA